MELREIVKCEECLWSKKTTIAWRNMGINAPDSFIVVESRSLANNISYLFIDGKRETNLVTVQEKIEDFYRDLFTKDVMCKWDFGNLNLRKLSLEQSEKLEVLFTKSEVKRALDDMVGDKTPGPDGIPNRFYQLCWSF